MPRPASVRWCKSGNAWRSDVGPFGAGKSPRRTPKYFREIPKTPKGRREAERQLSEYLSDRDRTEAAEAEDGANPRVGTGLVNPYLDSVGALVEADKRSEDTYRSHLDRLERWTKATDAKGVRFADRLASTLTPRDAERWIDGMIAEGLSATRIAGVVQSVQACLNWAATPQRGREPRVLLPAGNPFAGVKVDAASARVVRVSTRAEVARFLRAARKEVEPWEATPQGRCGGCKRAKRKNRCRRSHTKRATYYRIAILLCRLQAAIGTRPKELCTATWAAQVGDRPGWTPDAWKDEAGHWWGLIVVPGKTHRKTGRPRSIPVPPPIRRAIERIRAAGLDDRWIFPRSRRGEKGPGRWTTSAIDGRVASWRKAAGLPDEFALYALRHRFYSNAIHRGGLTADQAGAIGGTSGAVVRRVYLQEDLTSVFEGASKARDAGRDVTLKGDAKPASP